MTSCNCVFSTPAKMLVTILGLPLKNCGTFQGNEDDSATQWDLRKRFKVDLSFADFSQVPTFSMIFHAGTFVPALRMDFPYGLKLEYMESSNTFQHFLHSFPTLSQPLKKKFCKGAMGTCSRTSFWPPGPWP